MRNFLKGQTYYIMRDTAFMGISLLFLIVGILLPIWIGNKTNFQLNNWIEPLTQVTPLSLFLYFIIPIYLSFFVTEGFEHGSIKHIIASGYSRSKYITGKFMSAVQAITWWVFQFFGTFYVVYILAAWISGSSSDHQNSNNDLVTVATAITFNILYLAAYAAIIMLVSILAKRTATAVVATFMIIFGDFLISGYFKNSSPNVLLWLSEHTLTTQIMKFSGVYVVNSEHIVLSGLSDYLNALAIPLILIGFCLSITYILFRKKDIQS